MSGRAQCAPSLLRSTAADDADTWAHLGARGGHGTRPRAFGICCWIMPRVATSPYVQFRSAVGLVSAVRPVAVGSECGTGDDPRCSPKIMSSPNKLRLLIDPSPRLIQKLESMAGNRQRPGCSSYHATTQNTRQVTHEQADKRTAHPNTRETSSVYHQNRQL